MLETPLKKQPDSEVLRAAGAAALDSAQAGAEASAAGGAEPAPAAQPARRRGRPPGKYGSYKKRDRKPAAAASNESDPPRPAGDGGEAPRPAEELAERVELVEVPGSSVRRGLEFVFNRFLARRWGAHWALEEDELNEAAPITGEILGELIPSYKDDKWAYRLSVLGVIVTPRILQSIDNIGPKPAARKSEPAHPDPAQSNSDPRPPRTGQDFLVPVDPSKGFALDSR